MKRAFILFWISPAPKNINIYIYIYILYISVGFAVLYKNVPLGGSSAVESFAN